MCREGINPMEHVRLPSFIPSHKSMFKMGAIPSILRRIKSVCGAVYFVAWRSLWICASFSALSAASE